MSEIIYEVEAMQNAHRPLFARLGKMATSPGGNGTPYVQADIASITRSVFDKSGIVLPAFDEDVIVVATAIVDTLVGWPVDSIGYNLSDIVAPAAFAAGGEIVTVKYTITLSVGLGSTINLLLFKCDIIPVPS